MSKELVERIEALLAVGFSCSNDERITSAILKDCKAALSQKQEAVEQLEVGIYGKAFDAPGKRRAYTYAHQPDNITAFKVGGVVDLCCADKHGDNIDKGLSLLSHLSAAGFGIFELSEKTYSARRYG